MNMDNGQQKSDNVLQSALPVLEGFEAACAAFTLPQVNDLYDRFWNTQNKNGPDETLKEMANECSSQDFLPIVLMANPTYAQHIKDQICDAAVDVQAEELGLPSHDIDGLVSIEPLNWIDEGLLEFLPAWLDPGDGMTAMSAAASRFLDAGMRETRIKVNVSGGSKLISSLEDNEFWEFFGTPCPNRERYLKARSALVNVVGPVEFIKLMLRRNNFAEMISVTENHYGLNNTPYRTVLWRATFRILHEKLTEHGIRTTYCPELTFDEALRNTLLER